MAGSGYIVSSNCIEVGKSTHMLNLCRMFFFLTWTLLTNRASSALLFELSPNFLCVRDHVPLKVSHYVTDISMTVWFANCSKSKWVVLNLFRWAKDDAYFLYHFVCNYGGLKEFVSASLFLLQKYINILSFFRSASLLVFSASYGFNVWVSSSDTQMPTKQK